MTRQRYSAKEALHRILRLFENKPVLTDAPDTITGDLLSENESLSDLAELLAGSLPNETATLPSAITVPVTNIPTGSFSAPDHLHSVYSISSHIHPTYDLRVFEDSLFEVTGTAVVFGSNLNVSVTGTTFFVSLDPNVSITTLQVGTAPNYAYISNDGTFKLTGSATGYEDFRIDGLRTTVGVTAPTDETGFRGNANFLARNFVHNQADEVQFDVQLPHAWNAGSEISPHVHFSPWITGTASVQAARFILEYYWANINDTFPANSSSFAMEYTWTGSSQWKHLLAEHTGTVELVDVAKNMSSIMKARLYRDNTIANNLQGKVTFLYFDIHYQVDGFGSADEYTK